MGFFGQLKFALLCMDFLAWPVIALAFPMFVSIRAIESGSLYHMRKLVIYWSIFSSIYLFEFAFAKIVQWIPLWSSIRLMVIFWLVFPRFRGACCAYKNFIRPCLVLKLREAISRFEETSRAKSKEALLIDVADKYIKDNGFDALEKLIAAKRKYEEPYYNTQGDIGRLNESVEEHHESTLKQLKEPVAAALKDNEMLKVLETSVDVHPATEVSKATSYAAAVTKGVLLRPPALTLIPEKPVTAALPPPKESSPQQKWRCTLCQVETTSKSNLDDHLRGIKHKTMRDSLPKLTCTLCQVETSSQKNLNDHLRGSKHKAMCESLKLSKLNAKQGAIRSDQDGSKQNTTCKQPEYENEGPTRHWCFACDVELVGGASLMSHLNGKRHASNVTANGLS